MLGGEGVWSGFTDTAPNQKVLGIKELLFWVGG